MIYVSCKQPGTFCTPLTSKAHPHVVSLLYCCTAFSQTQDVLGHPATRLLVSHCGLHSVYEAAFHGVPVVGVPFMFEQVNTEELQWISERVQCAASFSMPFIMLKFIDRCWTSHDKESCAPSVFSVCV
jgi:hypothetical protein